MKVKNGNDGRKEIRRKPGKSSNQMKRGKE